MTQISEDTRTGAEILFDRAVKTAIFMTPSSELRADIYKALDDVVKAHYDHTDPIQRKSLTPKQITAYSALEKMGLICLENDLYFATQEGAKVHGSLDRNGVYKELPEELFRL